MPIFEICENPVSHAEVYKTMSLNYLDIQFLGSYSCSTKAILSKTITPKFYVFILSSFSFNIIQFKWFFPRKKPIQQLFCLLSLLL